MTLLLYLQCIAMFQCGQLVHLLLIKIPAVKKRTNAVNKAFLFIEWWKCDWNIIIATQVIGIAIIIGLDQILHWKPEIMDYVKWFFFFMGAFGSTVAMAKFSQYEKSITGLSDIKSNISDHMTGPAITVKDALEKGTFVTGKDVSKPTE
jgi:hypothetical protein